MAFILVVFAAVAPVACNGYAASVQLHTGVQSPQTSDPGLVVATELVSLFGDGSDWPPTPVKTPVKAQQRLESLSQVATISSVTAAAASIKTANSSKYSQQIPSMQKDARSIFTASKKSASVVPEEEKESSENPPVLEPELPLADRIGTDVRPDCTVCTGYPGFSECNQLCVDFHNECISNCFIAWDAAMGENAITGCSQRCSPQVAAQLKVLGDKPKEDPAIVAIDVPLPSKATSQSWQFLKAPPMWQVVKANLGTKSQLGSLAEQAQLLSESRPTVDHPGPLPAKDLLSSLGYGSSYSLGLEEASPKNTIWQPPNFESFAQALRKTSMPRIGLIELQRPSFGPAQGDDGRRVVAVLCSFDSHAEMWRGLYKAAFRSLRKSLPDRVHFTIVTKDADLTPSNIYKSAHVNKLGWNEDEKAGAKTKAQAFLAEPVAFLAKPKGKSEPDLNIRLTDGANKLVDDLVLLHSYGWEVFRINSGR